MVALGASYSGSAAAATSPRKVPLQTLYTFSAQFGQPVVTVTIGRSKPIPVILDTGSVGLRVFRTALPRGDGSGIRMTRRTVSEQFGLAPPLESWTWAGRIADARVTVGGLTTSRPVPFQVITSMTCGLNGEKCPSGLINGRPGLGVDHVEGVLGIGLLGPPPSGPTVNPLLSLPRPYSSRWSLRLGSPGASGHTGELVLGANTPTHPTARLPLDPLGLRPTTLWYDRPTLCWDVQNDESCAPTSLDSGSNWSVLLHRSVYPPKANPPPSLMQANVGVAVSDATGGAPFYSFVTGSDVLVTGPEGPVGVLGVHLFYVMTVTYDLVKGQITLSQ